MTLYDLGLEYRKSAEPLRVRLKELRAALKEAKTPDERFRIKRRIAELTPMLTHCNKMAEYCARYYEPGYYIGDGVYGVRRTQPRGGAVKQLSTQGVALHIDKRTYTKASDCRGGVFDKRSNVRIFGARTRRKQNDSLSKLL